MFVQLVVLFAEIGLCPIESARKDPIASKRSKLVTFDDHGERTVVETRTGDDFLSRRSEFYVEKL